MLHGAVADYLRPEGEAPTTDGHDFASRFATLLALASLFIPFFLFEFVATGNAPAAVALSITACVLAASACVYKWTGSRAFARDLFLGGLFVFLLWEASFFDTIYSPGTVWFGVMPVVSILLGSMRAAVGWLVIGIAAIGGTFLLTNNDDTASMVSSWNYELLFTVSVCGMILAIFLFVVIVDSGRSEAHARLVSANVRNRDLAERDELTGLYNRRALRDLLGGLMSEESQRAAVIFTDLDGFKDVNDTYGHHVGDRLIQAMAAGLKDISERRGATAARLGGDEFAIVVPGPGAAEKAEAIGQAMLDLVAAPISIDGRSAIVGMSLGLALAEEGSTAAELMRRADVALYAAKNGGRMRICRYRSELDKSRKRRRSIASMLERSLEAAEIEVHYQPIVCSKSHAVTGVEALARWTAATGEVVAPDEFISIAEESGLIDRLGLFVLERACMDSTDWPGIRIAVNLSPVQFRSPTLVEDILDVLARTGVEPGRLELEVTEGFLIEHRERAQPVIAALRRHGVRVVLDDFGSGYSSIGYLRQYEFDRLKIDRSLVTNMVRDEASRSIIQAVAILARSLSLKLTAEGVEDEDTARLLRLAGCDSLQGYCFGRPQSRRNIARLIKSRESVATNAS
jgi:diguanylate cyclase (GGDEF)-like protein